MHIFRYLFVAFVFLVNSSFAVATTVPQLFYGELDSPCHPSSHITCGLPYPSDIYTYQDNGSETGLRLEYPAGIIPDYLLENVPSSLTPQTVFNESNGFSAATSVLFELPEAPDISSLPTDGKHVVLAFNLDTGEQIPLRVQYNQYANSSRVSDPSHVIEIYPRSRWNFSDRYVVVLTSHLKTLTGENHTPSSGLLKALSGDNSRLSLYYSPIIQFLEQHGVEPDDLIDLTFFTVRSEAEVTTPITRLSQYVLEADHPTRRLVVTYPWFGAIGANVYGDVYVHDFRNRDGGMDYDVAMARGHWIRFHLTLPRSAKYEQAPIAIYGHGLGALKESGASISRSNAELGIATISIDHPNHGTRVFADGGYVLLRLDTPYVPLLSGMIVQSSVDFMSLLKAVNTSIGAIDVLPKRSWNPFMSTPHFNGDGIPDIDISNVFYQGTSLGGVLGSTFVALAPDLKGAFLQVTGAGVTNILSNSLLWEGVFSQMMPELATGAEALLLKSAMQHEVDYGDAINFVHYFRQPPNNLPYSIQPKPVGIAAGIDDGVVPNFSTAAMAEIAQLPLVGNGVFPLNGVDHVDDFDGGYGVVQIPPLLNIQGGLRGIFAHLSFTGSSAKAVMNHWISQQILSRQMLPEQ
ncbi:hypothetical protein A9Q99_22245 [Gammaproteobacteria bacterium 45_16_T64]|nr:hypothetical protein A9Q99_22245 [Gammaproteobacteria bacterium 45_16_T64]